MAFTKPWSWHMWSAQTGRYTVVFTLSLSDVSSSKETSKLPLLKKNVFLKYVSAAAAMFLQSCPTLCDPIDGSPPGSATPGILQARILEWVAISFSNAWKWKVKSESEAAQLCPTLHDPMDCSLPGSSVHEIFQARVLEWVAVAFSTYNEWI